MAEIPFQVHAKGGTRCKLEFCSGFSGFRGWTKKIWKDVKSGFSKSWGCADGKEIRVKWDCAQGPDMVK